MGKHIINALLISLMVVGIVSCGSHNDSNVNVEESGVDSLINVEEIDVEPEPDPYLVFDSEEEALSFMKESENWEHYSRGILPQMAKDELEYAEKLLNNKHDGFVVVDKSRMKVIKFNRFGEAEETFGMACAKNYGTKHKRSDSRTPEGFFSVKKIHNSTDWHFVDDDGVVSEKTGEFGPRFIRLNIPVTTQIGIHGTSAPWSIGGRRSHGCIRIKNENIMKLVEMVDSGMPVIITPGRKDMEVNMEEGYDIPSISTVPGKPHLTLIPKPENSVKEADSIVASDTIPSLIDKSDVVNAKDSVKDGIVEVNDTVVNNVGENIERADSLSKPATK